MIGLVSLERFLVIRDVKKEAVANSCFLMTQNGTKPPKRCKIVKMGLLGASLSISVVISLAPLFGWSRYLESEADATCSLDSNSQERNDVTYMVGSFLLARLLPILLIITSNVATCRGVLLAYRLIRIITKIN